jgi:hypothetical protein
MPSLEGPSGFLQAGAEGGERIFDQTIELSSQFAGPQIGDAPVPARG